MKRLNFSWGLAIALFLMATNLVLGQQTRIRYNLAGYEPDGIKRAVIVSDVDCNGRSWHLESSTGTTVLSGTIGASVTGVGEHTAKAYNHEIDFTAFEVLGEYQLVVDQIDPVKINIVNSPYQTLAHDVLRVIRVRRSGSSDAIDHGFSHGGDASTPIYEHNGGSSMEPSAWENQNRSINMLGGWYDAGDYLKFTITTAYTAYNILLAYKLNPEIFDGVKRYSSTGWDDLLDEAKWGLDYLLKTMPDDNTFVIQVGSEDDHNQGQRLPENDALDGHRNAYTVKSKPQMALTVAALAMGYQVFKDQDQSLANTYLAKAEGIYAQFNINSTDLAYYEAESNPFYMDENYNDNAALAATELYLATNSSAYLDDAKTYIDAAEAGYWASWADVNLKANYRLASEYNKAKNFFLEDLDHFLKQANKTDNVWKIPHDYVWGSLYSQFGVANGAFTHMLMEDDNKYEDMARGVINYTFGLNNWGRGFVASENYPMANETSYAQIYRLQPNLFPIGEIAEGPVPKSDHVPMVKWFDPAINPDTLHIQGTSDLYNDFNTSSSAYYEFEGDFVCPNLS
jgi:hypothetical protein